MNKKSKKQLLSQIKALRIKIVGLEKIKNIHKQAEQALKKSEEKWRSLVRNIPDIIMTVARDGTILAINHTVIDLTVEEVIGQSVYDYVAFQQSEIMRNSLERVFKTGKSDTYEILGTGIGGPNSAWYESRVVPIKSNKKVTAVTLISSNITERKKAEMALQQSESKYRTLVDNVNFGVYRNTGGQRGRFLHANPAITKMFGYDSVEEFMKVPISRLYQKQRERRLFVKEVRRRGFVKNKQLRLRKKDGTPIWGSVTAKAQFDKKRNIKWIDGVIEDISERKKAEERLGRLNQELIRSNKRLKQLTLRDTHTGLYNHRYLGEIIEAEFQRAKRYAHSLSVIMLDIDYFKSINDVYGHLFGDLVLRQMAKLLKRHVRKYDVVVRFGGEEFIILSPRADRSTALTLAQRFLDTINLYNFGNKKHLVKLKLSLAVASYPEDKTSTGIHLIELVDQILNKVKEHGGNRVYSSIDARKRQRYYRADISNVEFLREKIEKLSKRANQSLGEAVFAFARTIKLKDHYTGEHVERIVHYATEIAKALNLPKDEIERIREASILHDLGKIGISEKILLKRAKLGVKEFNQIKKHPEIGADIIRPIHFLHSIIPLILYHHERWDGKGYPRGLKRKEIPIGARIVAVSDVYQALISDRPYRKAYSKQKAIAIIKEGSGVQFDPKIIRAFLKIIKNRKRF